MLAAVIVAGIVALFALLAGIDVPASSAPASSQDLTSGRALRAPSVNRMAFVSDVRQAATQVDMRQIPLDLALVLFDLETGTGTGDIFIHTNNPGSIKSTVGWTGKPSYKDTRVYPTLADGIRDWVRLITEAKGPAPAHADYRKAYDAAKRRDFKGFFDALNDAGYEKSIDPPYNQRLASRLSQLKYEGYV